jgi:hypothetical protein
MTRNGTTGGTIVSSVQHEEGHETMDEDVLTPPSITTGHGALFRTLQTLEDIGL